MAVREQAETAMQELLETPAGHAAVRRIGTGGQQGRILIVPPFGIPARTLSFVADQLAERGYEACLLDVRNHVGDGSGTMHDYQLSAVVDDCRNAIRRYEPTGVIGLSLGGRALLRATASSGLHPHAVLLIPVVNLRSTLTEVLGRDLYLEPEVPEFHAVLGHSVRSKPFLDDALHHGLLSPEGTAHDLATLTGTTTLFPLDGDQWVDVQEVQRVSDCAQLQGARITTTAMAGNEHELHKHPELALRMIAAAVEEIDRLHQLQPAV